MMVDATETDEIINFVAEGEAVSVPRNEPIAVEVTDAALIVTTRDGRVIHTPLSWFPFLMNASAEQRQNFRVLGWEVMWEELDDGVSMETILLGDPHQ